MRKIAAPGRPKAVALPEMAAQRYRADLERLRGALADAQADQAGLDEIARINAAIVQATTMLGRAQGWVDRAAAGAPAGTSTRPGNAQARRAASPDGRVRTARREVSDPYGSGDLIRVMVNRDADALEHEHAAGRITTGEFNAGRAMQAVWGSGGHIGTIDLSAEVRGPRYVEHGLSVPDLRLLGLIVRARAAEDLTLQVAEIIGAEGATLMRSIITGCRSIAASADAREWFCKALETVTDALYAARGPERGKIRYARVQHEDAVLTAPPAPAAAETIGNVITLGREPRGARRPIPKEHLPLAAE